MSDLGKLFTTVLPQKAGIAVTVIEERLEIILNTILGTTMIALQVGITLLFFALLLRNIPRLSKEEWIINSRKTFFLLGVILIVLTFAVRTGNGFGVGGGNGIGFGEEDSAGSDETVENSEKDGKTSDETGQSDDIAHTEQAEEQLSPPIMSDAEIVIRIREKDIYYNNQLCTIEQVENIIKKEHKDGMTMRVQDDYAEDITYSQILTLLDTYQIRYEKERLE